MSFFETPYEIGASALSTEQRLRLDRNSNNIAKAQTTRTENGTPYQRQDVIFQPQGSNPKFPCRPHRRAPRTARPAQQPVRRRGK